MCLEVHQAHAAFDQERSFERRRGGNLPSPLMAKASKRNVYNMCGLTKKSNSKPLESNVVDITKTH